MSELVLIIGESGSGKSRSTKNLPAEETIMINVVDKSLPYKGWKKKYTTDKKIKEGGNYVATDRAQTINQILDYVNAERPEIKYVVIDDFQYVLSNKFMHKSQEKSYDKFTEIAKDGWSIFNKAGHLRDDLIVFILTHEDQTDLGKRKIKTIGKLLDNQITLEGLATVVLFTKVEQSQTGDNTYHFITQTENSTGKSPDGMFESKVIPNDLLTVAKSINDYNYGDSN